MIVSASGRKLVSLAKAIPTEKYGWSPTPEVRSVSEVFMHVVANNLLLLPGLLCDAAVWAPPAASLDGRSRLGFTCSGCAPPREGMGEKSWMSGTSDE